MVFSRLLANENLISIDIGSSNIKIIYADIAKHGGVITHAVSCPTPPEAVKEGIIINVLETAEAIQFAMRSAGIKGANAVTAIAGPGVVVRNVVMPKMSEQILRKSIRFEAGKYISVPMEDSVVEFDILGDAADNQMNVALVAAPREMIDTRATVLEQAGLEPLSIDVEAFATLRALVEMNPDDSVRKGTIALLDIGASHTEINLVSSGVLSLTRTIPIAGTALTNAIKSVENCSDEEAEQMKHALDVSPSTDQSTASGSTSSLRTVQQLIDELLREIRRSFNYYQSQLPEGASESAIEKVIITGGASRLKGLAPYMQSRLNVDVTIGNPLSWFTNASSSRIEGLSEEDYPLFTVALGLVAKEMSMVKKPAKAVLAR
ncbi:MAG: type IV pilus assembly protein PilM [Armatimonadota bacterium]